MNPIQAAKQELEASIRYCENAMSSAKQTIESMKKYQQQTGREESLTKNLAFMTEEYDRMKGYADKLIDEKVELEERYDEAKTNMALMTDELEELRGIIDRMGDDSTGDSVTIKQLRETLVEREDKWDEAQSEIATLKDQLAEMSKAYKDSTHEEITMKKAWREQRELVALRDDQIAMLERRLAKYTGEKTYPFKEGDLYYVLNQLDGTWIESVWDDESERLHDSTDFPDHPHKVYFTVDQKNVLDKFKSEELT